MVDYVKKLDFESLLIKKEQEKAKLLELETVDSDMNFIADSYWSSIENALKNFDTDNTPFSEFKEVMENLKSIYFEQIEVHDSQILDNEKKARLKAFINDLHQELESRLSQQKQLIKNDPARDKLTNLRSELIGLRKELQSLNHYDHKINEFLKKSHNPPHQTPAEVFEAYLEEGRSLSHSTSPLGQLDKLMGLSKEAAKAYSNYSSQLLEVSKKLDTSNDKTDEKLFLALSERLAKDLARDSIAFECEMFKAYQKENRVADFSQSMSMQMLFYAKMKQSEFSPYLTDIAAYYVQYIGSTQIHEAMTRHLESFIKPYLLFPDQTKQEQVYKYVDGKVIISSTAGYTIRDDNANSYDAFDGESVTIQMTALEAANDPQQPNKKRLQLSGFSTGPLSKLILFGEEAIRQALWNEVLFNNVLMQKYVSTLVSPEKDAVEKQRNAMMSRIKAALADENTLNSILKGTLNLKALPAVQDFQSFIDSNIGARFRLEYLEKKHTISLTPAMKANFKKLLDYCNTNGKEEKYVEIVNSLNQTNLQEVYRKVQQMNLQYKLQESPFENLAKKIRSLQGNVPLALIHLFADIAHNEEKLKGDSIETGLFNKAELIEKHIAKVEKQLMQAKNKDEEEECKQALSDLHSVYSNLQVQYLLNLLPPEIIIQRAESATGSHVIFEKLANVLMEKQPNMETVRAYLKEAMALSSILEGMKVQFLKLQGICQQDDPFADLSQEIKKDGGNVSSVLVKLFSDLSIAEKQLKLDDGPIEKKHLHKIQLVEQSISDFQKELEQTTDKGKLATNPYLIKLIALHAKLQNQYLVEVLLSEIMLKKIVNPTFSHPVLNNLIKELTQKDPQPNKVQALLAELITIPLLEKGSTEKLRKFLSDEPQHKSSAKQTRPQANLIIRSFQWLQKCYVALFMKNAKRTESSKPDVSRSCFRTSHPFSFEPLKGNQPKEHSNSSTPSAG